MTWISAASPLFVGVARAIQAFSIFGLLLAPIGLVWLGCDAYAYLHWRRWSIVPREHLCGLCAAVGALMVGFMPGSLAARGAAAPDCLSHLSGICR